VELLATLDCDLIVTECGSCSGFLKEYRELLPDESPGADLGARVRDFTELLATLALPEPAERGTLVTYHDPCHLGRAQGIREQPRKLLVDVGGFELREMADADRCCGGAGSYNLTHPGLSRTILGQKLDRAEATEAEVVATACPACIMQLDWGSRERGLTRPVRHVAELLAERQGL
jgi:glycolate oxidase iron-sulfur subunit